MLPAIHLLIAVGCSYWLGIEMAANHDSPVLILLIAFAALSNAAGVLPGAGKIIAKLEAKNTRLRDALQKNRQGYHNLLEMRQLSSQQWGRRDGYGGRYGALTREEIETVIAQIDEVLR